MHILRGPLISLHPHATREYGPHKVLALHINPHKVTSLQNSRIKARMMYKLQDLFPIFFLEETFFVGGQEEQETQQAGFFDYKFLSTSTAVNIKLQQNQKT
jgi:hypothetical protein